MKQATLALLGKILCLKLLFIAIKSGTLKGPAVTLIKAGGILALLIAFFGFSCWRVLEFHYYAQTKILCYH